MAPLTDYPKRPKFFATKFCRLLLKACVANELGPEAAMLLMAVANTEDARGYRGPVNFWNSQLQPLVGCRSDSALKRVRAKCERAGWLVHTPGTKWAPPSYHVAVPSQFDGWDDSASDESAGDYDVETTVENGRQAGGERAASERQAGGERPDSFPIPVPIPEEPPPPESAEPTADKPPRPEEVIAAWNAVPGLPAFKGTNPRLRQLLAERWRDQRFRERWRDVIAALSRSDWHTGKAGGDAPFVATLSWFVEERGWDKAFAVLERQDAKPAPPPPVGRSKMLDCGPLDGMTAQSLRDRMAAHRGGITHGV